MPKCIFSATSVGFLGTAWQKSGLHLKKAKSMVFALLDPSTRKISTLVIIFAKVRSLPTYLCRKFVSNVFGLSPMAV